MKHAPKPTFFFKALCLFFAAALPLGLAFALPIGELTPQALPASRVLQAQGVQCALLPQEGDLLPLPLPQLQGDRKLREPWNPLAWTLPPGLPPLFLRGSQRLRFPLYLPVFQRHVLVRVGTHAPPAHRIASYFLS